MFRRYCLCCALALGLTTSSHNSPVSAQDGSNTDIFVSDARIKLKKELEVHLASERAGVIASIEFSQGDVVQAQDQVVQLKDDVARATYATAKEKASNDIEVRFAQAAYELAIKDLDRSVKANQRLPGTVPEAEVEKLRLTVTKTRLQIEQAEHQFTIAKLESDESLAQLKSYRIDSPIKGTVDRVLKTTGEAVSQGETIVEIVNTSVLRVEGEVGVDQVDAINRGDGVTVRFNSGGTEQTRKGRVVDIDRTATSVGARVKVFAEIQNSGGTAQASTERLRAGLTATLIIHAGKPAPQPETANVR